jgi:hypothetical protein
VRFFKSGAGSSSIISCKFNIKVRCTIHQLCFRWSSVWTLCQSFHADSLFLSGYLIFPYCFRWGPVIIHRRVRLIRISDMHLSRIHHWRQGAWSQLGLKLSVPGLVVTFQTEALYDVGITTRPIRYVVEGGCFFLGCNCLIWETVTAFPSIILRTLVVSKLM